MERRGSGLKKIADKTNALFADNRNHVSFYSDNNYFRVKIYNANYSLLNISQHDTSASDGTVNGTVRLVFDLISKTPDITIDNLINETGKSRRTISRALKQLKDSGYIARRGSDRAGTWEIIHDRMDSNF